jgi:hypothetical protein
MYIPNYIDSVIVQPIVVLEEAAKPKENSK